jgi:biopolymer transport protein ExbD
MKTSRRMMRLSRFRSKVPGLNLTSLMDVFTILVFFLVMNSAPRCSIRRPRAAESVIDAKPSETVVINVGTEEVLVQGGRRASGRHHRGGERRHRADHDARLAELQDSVIGVRTQVVAQSMAITILADKSIPFSVVKQVMSTCTAQGYTRISLAVIQKESAVASAAAPVSSAGTGI